MQEHKQSVRATFTGQPATVKGRYQILFIREGEANGWTFSRQVLQSSAALWENASVFVDHSLWGRSVRDLGGVLSNAAWSEEFAGLTAELTPAGPSAEIIRQAAELMLAAGPKPDIGFSADIVFQADAQRNVQSILQPISVDLVMDPAFATKFIRQLNQRQKGVTLSPIDTRTQRAPVDAAEHKALVSALLEARLAASDLPEAAMKDLRGRFGAAYDPQSLEAAIQAWKDGLAAQSAPGEIQGPGRVTSMFNGDDQLQAAIDDLVGAPREKGAEALQVARFTGLKEAYITMTGDRDMVGGYFQDRIRFQHTTASFPGLVKNALNKALVREWDQLGRARYNWWQKIVRVEHFESLNDITWLLFGTIASLPTVAEGGEYTELKIGDSPETSSFIKKGGYIGLTLEAIDRDDGRKLRAIPRELANAGLREISALVAGIFTQNGGVGPTMADGGALFNSNAQTSAGGHKNLLTAALGTDFTAWDAVATAMYRQPMLVANESGVYGTGKYMAVEPRYILVPRELKAQAEALFIPRWASTIEAAIAVKGGPTFGAYVEPITVPEWTDASDWAAVADPAIVPGIMIGERFGLIPQIYIAGSEIDPAMFANDEQRLKVRHFIAVGVADYRPLHKSNV